VKTCGLIPEGCADVHIRIGEILHPMQTEHSIQWIDFYIDKEFVSRIKLPPEKLNPAAGLHLKIQSGKLTAVENCNLHGTWMNEETI
jgi:superoxide reductase